MEEEYYKTQQSAEEYIRLAKDSNGKQLIEKLEKFLPIHSVLMELGSGPGTDWNILNKSYSIIGSDNSMNFLSHLKNENPDGEFFEIDATTIDTDRKFDGIYSNKVLHHLKDDALLSSVNRQSKVLNDDGIVCHSFWKGEGSEIFKGLFVNYHNEKNLKEIFEPYFEIILLETYQEFEDDDSLLLIGKKKNNS